MSLGGWSLSDSSGTKTQSIWDTCGFCDRSDFWIVKTDSSGNKQWDKDFGGTNADRLYSLQQTADGGYILGGSSQSDSSGNKSQNTWTHSFDYWIVKTDSLGNKQWDKDFGGKNQEILYSVCQTDDGGYILGGISISNISGDKTQVSQGDYDYWIVKTDSLGNKLWDRDFGGTNRDDLVSLQQTADGGYILAGRSQSDSSGDKTQNCVYDSISTFTSDFWIVKTDSLGNKQWDKDFGGSYIEDDFGNVIQTADGGYLIAGASYSHVGGNKTEDNLGTEQSWVIKTDSSGNIQWDKTIFTLGHDEKG